MKSAPGKNFPVASSTCRSRTFFLCSRKDSRKGAGALADIKEVKAAFVERDVVLVVVAVGRGDEGEGVGRRRYASMWTNTPQGGTMAAKTSRKPKRKAPKYEKNSDCLWRLTVLE